MMVIKRDDRFGIKSINYSFSNDELGYYYNSEDIFSEAYTFFLYLPLSITR